MFTKINLLPPDVDFLSCSYNLIYLKWSRDCEAVALKKIWVNACAGHFKTFLLLLTDLEDVQAETYIKHEEKEKL